ncbi:unnamed protein product [Lymnaea stagnalis]|uniref:Methyltransferase FkbM domain-containing protein n=1 Tax=Lymnaea stagnalis TaxID=6523 RepID=A0AAV2I7T5_LYMST
MRSLKRLKQLTAVAAILALVCLSVTLVRSKIDLLSSPQQPKHSVGDTTDFDIHRLPKQRDLHSLHPAVNIVPSSPQGQLALQQKDCIEMPGSIRQGLYICVHPVKDDTWVSGTLKSGKLWEASLIKEMMTAFEADASLQLVDLGCNIGEFTLCAAALDRHVLSVEMMMINVQLLQMSLQLSNLSSMVTIVNNAVYSDRRELGVTIVRNNVGGNRLNVSYVPIAQDIVDDSAAKVTVKTICLNDLVPLVRNTRVYLKMDIQNSEHSALQCAEEFFKEVDVKIVQMEWIHRLPEDSKLILAFMTTQGYDMSTSANTYNAVDLNAIPGDVFFLRNYTM